MKETIYLFKDVPDLCADTDGNFYYKNRPVKKIYNNGTLSVRTGNTKLGIKKLRSLAYRSFIEKTECPF